MRNKQLFGLREKPSSRTIIAIPSKKSKRVKALLEKAQDSAVQAVTIYNNPGNRLRTGSFIVLMCIAWTALLHAYLESRKIKYHYKSNNGRYVKVDGDRKAWDLSNCLKEIFGHQDPIRANIELFVKLRNKVEHRDSPALNAELLGECQALIINFEDWLVDKFGEKYSLMDTSFIPIQLLRNARAFPKTKSDKEMLAFIKEYRGAISTDIINSQEYSFKAFVMPKIGNHRSSSDIAIEYVKYDENNTGEMEEYEKAMVAIKERHIPVINKDKMRPGRILSILRDRGHKPTMHWHTKMWKKYKVRPGSKAENKAACDTEYCIYDEAHGDYLYSKSWLNFLLEKELEQPRLAL